jgi:hypothetical protein
LKFIRSFIVSVLIFSLGGCAFPKYQTVVREKDTGYEKTYDPKLPLKTYKAINYVKIDEFGVMTVNPKVITEYDELEAPKVEKTALEKKPPDLVGTIVVTGLTLGLNLLVATSDTFKMLTGDSKNERVIGTDIDMTRAKKTGIKVSKASFDKSAGPIRIDGLIDGPLTLFGEKDNKYDLSTYIRADTGYEVIKPIFITCMECNETIPGQTGITNTLRHDINIQEIKNKIIKPTIPVRPHGQPG